MKDRIQDLVDQLVAQHTMFEAKLSTKPRIQECWERIIHKVMSTIEFDKIALLGPDKSGNVCILQAVGFSDKIADEFNIAFNEPLMVYFLSRSYGVRIPINVMESTLIKTLYRHEPDKDLIKVMYFIPIFNTQTRELAGVLHVASKNPNHKLDIDDIQKFVETECVVPAE